MGRDGEGSGWGTGREGEGSGWGMGSAAERAIVGMGSAGKGSDSGYGRCVGMGWMGDVPGRGRDKMRNGQGCESGKAVI